MLTGKYVDRPGGSDAGRYGLMPWRAGSRTEQVKRAHVKHSSPHQTKTRFVSRSSRKVGEAPWISKAPNTTRDTQKTETEKVLLGVTREKKEGGL